VAGWRKDLSRIGGAAGGCLLLILAGVGVLIALVLALNVWIYVATVWQGAVDEAGTIPTVLVVAGFGLLMFMWGRESTKL
jgi:hypothetical protein